jgi:hypothetical protein
MESMMPRGISKDLENFKETLEKGVILVGGEAVNNNSIDPDDDTPVSVAIMFDVNGFGPHVGTICAVQGGHIDEALQAADEILEEWTRDHYPPKDADEDETLTETFDGIMWELPAEDFVAAIKGTAAEKYIDVVEYEDEPSEVREGVGEIRPYGPGKFSTILDSYAYDLVLDGFVDEEISIGEGNGWYGLIQLGSDGADSIRKIAKEQKDPLTPDEEEFLSKQAAVIFFERSDGIVETTWHDDELTAQQDWEELEAEFEEEEED